MKDLAKEHKATEEEVEISHSIASAFANKFYVSTLSDFGVQISFCEVSGRKTFPRASVTMALSDAVALKDLLDKMIAQTIKTDGDKNARNN